MDFYIVLGVNRGASLLEVKKAYRRLARRLHPDVNPGDERAALRFREIAEAYSTLSDPDRRQRYDLVGYEAPIAARAGAGLRGVRFLGGGLREPAVDVWRPLCRRPAQRARAIRSTGARA